MGPGKSVHYKGVFTNQGCSLWEVSLYTKPVTAAVSSQLKTMLHLHTSNPQGIPTNMINMSTWQCAGNAVKDNLIRKKELGLQELSDSISGDQQKTTAVRLKTFYT